ncbi:alkaline phosphatase PhoX [Luteolibacter algae]|uniref:Alkaline phosphatase PhoX n=1 Tax=Luteolibacter algae TaxID=454151 RepID=A0ABW5D3S3_9BACT
MKYQTLLVAGLFTTGLNAGILTTEGSYFAPSVNSDFSFAPLITVGDRVPMSGATAGEEFVFTGIPDAMGINRDRETGERVLYVAHEFPNSTTTSPIPGAAKKLKGAYVSRFSLDADGSIIEGGLAHSSVLLNGTEIDNPNEDSSSAFSRFCSGSFAGRDQGLDRPFFFTNEESGLGSVYDNSSVGGGALSVAVVDGKMHTLPALGRVARETTIVQPRRDRHTVVISTEDGGYPSYIYMFVGEKSRSGSDPIAKNGLAQGKTYVLASKGAKANPTLQGNNGTLTQPGAANAIDTEWSEIPNAATMNSNELKIAADAAGGFAFNRVEDCEFDPAKPTRTLFVGATGGSGANTLGRLYEVSLDPVNPAGEGKLGIVYNAELVAKPGGTYTNVSTGRYYSANGGTQSSASYTGGSVANGADYPVSIDNLAVSKDFIVVCEDRNSPADAVFSQHSRNGGVWTLDRNNGMAAKLQATFNYSYVEGRDNHSAINAGQWESSGVIDSSNVFGEGTFVINIQAHDQTVNILDAGGQPTNTTKKSMRTTAPDGNGGTLSVSEALSRFNEDGQVLLMRLNVR